MYLKFSNKFICPECRNSLTLTVFTRESEWVVDGLLRCSSGGHYYPVIDGIPRLLPLETLNKLVKSDDIKGYFSSWAGQLPEAYVREFTGIKADAEGMSSSQKCALYYSFMWGRYDTQYNRSDMLEFDRLTGGALDFGLYKGRSVIDCGSGGGRFLYPLLQAGAAEVVCIDLGGAIQYASRKHRADERVLCVQGDIYKMPFRNEFDLAMSIGVLQHLPLPEEALARIFGIVKDGGRMFVWCYGESSIKRWLLLARSMVNKLPLRLLWILSAVPVAIRYGLALFVGIMQKIGRSSWADGLPSSSYVGHGFLYFWVNTFDHLSAQIIAFFSEVQLRDWLKKLNGKSKLRYKLTERFKGRSNASWVIDVCKISV